MTARIPALVAAILLSGAALAQAPSPDKGPAVSGKQAGGKKARAAKSDEVAPNAFQGFSGDSDQPVTIESDSLEIHDKDSYAIFIGNVVVTQGESVMRSRQLKVFYEGSMRGAAGVEEQKSAPAKPAPAPAKAGTENAAQQIRRIEALGGVVITAKDQRATGDRGDFDMRSNIAIITGNVVVTQGPNIMRADKLIVDMKTGLSRMEAGGRDGQGRVQGLFVPKADDTKKGDRKK